MCAMCGRNLSGCDHYEVIVNRIDYWGEPKPVLSTPRICRLCAAKVMDYLTEQTPITVSAA
jgi:hypothetical protein